MNYRQTGVAEKIGKSIPLDDYDHLAIWEQRKHDVVVAAISNGKSYEEADDICQKLGYNNRIELLRESIDRRYKNEMAWAEMKLKTMEK